MKKTIHLSLNIGKFSRFFKKITFSLHLRQPHLLHEFPLQQKQATAFKTG